MLVELKVLYTNPLSLQKIFSSQTNGKTTQMKPLRGLIEKDVSLKK
jgi:hypothetical protein